MKTPQPTTSARRQFIKNTALLAPALTLFPSWLTASTGSRLRLAFIGVGAWGQQYLQAALQHKDIRVTAICEQDAGALQQTKLLFNKAGIALPTFFNEGGTGFKTMLSRAGIDAVIVATPWHSHYETAKAALLAGKHVACGPVMGSTLEEHWDIVKTSKQTGKQYITLDEQSYRRDLQAISQLLTAGQLGQLQTIQAGAAYHTLADNKANTTLPYPVYPAAITAQMLGISAGNPYTSLEVQQHLQDYVIMKQQPKTGTARLYVDRGLVNTIRLTTSRHQSVYLQSPVQNDQRLSTGFRVQATGGTWMDISKTVYLTGKAVNSVALDCDHEQSPVRETIAMAFHDFVKTLQQPAGNQATVCTAATNSIIGTLADLSAHENNRTIEFPNFYA